MAYLPQNRGRFALILVGIAGAALVAAAATRAEAPHVTKLTVRVVGIKSGGPIPPEYAFCVPAAQGHSTNGPNKNPAIKWSKGPYGTQSYAIIVVDVDVPSVFDDANKEGKTIPAKMKRINFYHMLLVDIPLSKTGLAEGADANGITPRGKAPGPTANGIRGVNDYTAAFTGDALMEGKYGGYDGPCPPWNDKRVHHYHFRVYALDVPSLALTENFGPKEVEAAIAQHTLAKGEVVGTFTQNPDLMKPAKHS
jgi:Raf kinase inhibitor-like YbhB/YbcL family protein